MYKRKSEKGQIYGPSTCSGFVWYPGQESTGSRGYLANRGSLRDSSHSRKTDPRLDSTEREWTQSAQSPELSRDFQLLDAFAINAE
jgi:hypothetical protein